MLRLPCDSILAPGGQRGDPRGSTWVTRQFTRSHRGIFSMRSETQRTRVSALRQSVASGAAAADGRSTSRPRRGDDHGVYYRKRYRFVRPVRFDSSLAPFIADRYGSLMPCCPPTSLSSPSSSLVVPEVTCHPYRSSMLLPQRRLQGQGSAHDTSCLDLRVRLGGV